MENPRIESLLVEIRDLQRQHLEEYRRNAGESIAAQRAAIEQASKVQQRLARLIRVFVPVIGVVVICLLWFLFRHA
ncbi:hypothetical protein [Duganella sp. Root336D2]|uniref:hypothetical protein n=1 Tax=Duganella sp. Root336D2 TaxID=1736518 RepID=UPI0012E33503|nr:hypothetical protein [Duganella sp. Root336D2]